MVELGYSVAPAYRNQGYATEAIGALVEYAAQAGATVVTAHTLPQTNASTRVLIKLGFTMERVHEDPKDGPVWRWIRPLGVPVGR